MNTLFASLPFAQVFCATLFRRAELQFGHKKCLHSLSYRAVFLREYSRFCPADRSHTPPTDIICNCRMSTATYLALADVLLSAHLLYIAWVIFGAFFTRGRPKL